MNLILCGMPRCGKTTFGRAAAKKLGMDFLDVDEEMEKAHGCTLGELYSQIGEKEYRLKEHQVISRLAPLRPTIVALGGGSLMFHENLPILKIMGTLIYLKVPYLALLKRILEDPPIFIHDAYEELPLLIQKRCPIYESIADHIFEVPLQDPISAFISSIEEPCYG